MNVQTNDNCLEEYDNLKFRKSEARYIIYAIIDEKIVIMS